MTTKEPDQCETCGMWSIPIDEEICPNCGEFMDIINPDNIECVVI